MPPQRTGQLDEISEAIGRLSGQVESLDRYTHEREHGLNNLAQKVDGISSQISREVARMKAELQVQLDAMDRRIAALEASGQVQRGQRNVIVWVLQSPLVGWLVAAVFGWLALWKKP